MPTVEALSRSKLTGQSCCELQWDNEKNKTKDYIFSLGKLDLRKGQVDSYQTCATQGVTLLDFTQQV